MELVSMRKAYGTMDFELRMGKMKKAEKFCTYPIQRGDSGAKLYLQSHHRWAELDTATGEVVMSARRAQYADSVWLAICKAKGTVETDRATPEQLAQILAAVRGTAGTCVGGPIMYCDNSNAWRAGLCD